MANKFIFFFCVFVKSISSLLLVLYCLVLSLRNVVRLPSHCYANLVSNLSSILKLVASR